MNTKAPCQGEATVGEKIDSTSRGRNDALVERFGTSVPKTRNIILAHGLAWHTMARKWTGLDHEAEHTFAVGMVCRYLMLHGGECFG